MSKILEMGEREKLKGGGSGGGGEAKANGKRGRKERRLCVSRITYSEGVLLFWCESQKTDSRDSPQRDQAPADELTPLFLSLHACTSRFFFNLTSHGNTNSIQVSQPSNRRWLSWIVYSMPSWVNERWQPPWRQFKIRFEHSQELLSFISFNCFFFWVEMDMEQFITPLNRSIRHWIRKNKDNAQMGGSTLAVHTLMNPNSIKKWKRNTGLTRKTDHARLTSFQQQQQRCNLS